METSWATSAAIRVPSVTAAARVVDKFTRRSRYRSMAMKFGVLLTVGLIASSAFAQPQKLTVAQWQADIDFLSTELPKRHPNPFHDVSRATFLETLSTLRDRVPILSDFEILLGMQQVVALIREGHTLVVTTTPDDTYFPIRVEHLSDGWFVTRTTNVSRDACGARVVAIDGMGIDEVIDRFATTVSRENDPWLLANAGTNLMRANVLHELGITIASDSAVFTLERGGAHFDLPLQAIGQRFGPLTNGDDWPLYLQHSEKRYWYSWDVAARRMYVKYNVCQDDPQQAFAQFTSEVFGVVDANDVQEFIVDVRNNGGGNSSVIQPMLNAINSRSRLKGHVYAIMGRETFSSGIFAVNDLRNRGATLAGEPTGGKPNSWGEVLSFSLPNSGTSVRYSTKFFTLVPGDPASFEPMLSAPISSSDYFARRDAVLDAIDAARATVLSQSPNFRRRAVAPPAIPIAPECPK
jgi:hypothetical protein